MLGKVGASGFKVFSRFSRGIITKHSISIPNRPNVCPSFELYKSLWRSSTRTLCNETVVGSQGTVLFNVQSSAESELKKARDSIHDLQTVNDFESKNAWFGKEFAAQSPSTYSNVSVKDEFTNDISDDNDDTSSERNSSKCTTGVQPLDINQMSRFQLPENWLVEKIGSQGIQFPGQIYVIKSIHDEHLYMNVLKDFLTQKVLGFDTEQCPINNNLCVIQLATHDKAVLWQCLNFEKMPHYLKKLLTGSVPKVGHSCLDDAMMISRKFREDPINLIDTHCWAKDMDCWPKSLQGLCEIFLGEKISKTHQRSNWKKRNLSPAQIRYAATDAWMSLRVYEEMKKQAEELDITLTPMYKTLQQRFDEILITRREKRRRRRQIVKQKKREIKAMSQLQQMTDSSKEKTCADLTVSLNPVVSNDADAGMTCKDSVPWNNEYASSEDDGIDDVGNAVEMEKDSEKKGIGSRQRHKKFLAKFHSLE